MLSREFEEKVRHLSEKVVGNTLGNTQITADALTLMCLLLTLGVVWLLVEGALLGAGILFLIASSFDLLDGALARSKGTARPFGAFLDSTVDRYSELLVFLGLLINHLYGAPVDPLYVTLLFVGSHGSLLTSYTRARAEALGYDGRGGLLDRPGRVILLAAGLLTGWLMPCLLLLAVLTHISALQRIMFVWRQSKQS
ncbi:MAG TPA: CDP-alcohol phosphatidyltransferase family protein [Chloroflexaceae bacterium]|nr:CDP-alcohol phosphatidyltransferase family protein [Chloroflexaceae bacterium]